MNKPLESDVETGHTTTQKPTAAAMRAVHELCDQCAFISVKDRRWAANVIDTETGLPKLIAALRDVLAQQAGTEKSCGHAYYCVCPTDAAWAALARYEEK